MKKITVFILVLVLCAGLCACRKSEPATTTPSKPTVTTVPATTHAATTVPQTSEAEITVPDMTVETNIPDPDVDREHLIETTTVP